MGFHHNPEYYFVLAQSYVRAAKVQRAIGRVYPEQNNTARTLARSYMKLARSAYNTFLITAIYGEN